MNETAATALEVLAVETPRLCLPYAEVEDLVVELVNGPALLAGGRLDESHPDFAAAENAVRAHVARVCREALPFLHETEGEVDQSWVALADRAAETLLAGNVVRAFDLVQKFDTYYAADPDRF